MTEIRHLMCEVSKIFKLPGYFFFEGTLGIFILGVVFEITVNIRKTPENISESSILFIQSFPKIRTWLIVLGGHSRYCYQVVFVDKQCEKGKPHNLTIITINSVIFLTHRMSDFRHWIFECPMPNVHYPANFTLPIFFIFMPQLTDASVIEPRKWCLFS